MIDKRRWPKATPALHFQLGAIRAFIIGAAMAQHVDHPLEHNRLQGLACVVPHCAGDAAHERCSVREERRKGNVTLPIESNENLAPTADPATAVNAP